MQYFTVPAPPLPEGVVPPGEPNEPAPVSGICTSGMCLGVVSALDSTVFPNTPLPAVLPVVGWALLLLLGLVPEGVGLGALAGLPPMVALGANIMNKRDDVLAKK